MNIYGDLGDYECDKCTSECKYHAINPPFICAVCGAEITRRQYIESDRRLGAPVCAQCECTQDKESKTCLLQRMKHFIDRLRESYHE